MPDLLAEARQELATANRVLANEGVLDAFGHISMRHPTNPDRYLISRYGAAELMMPADILELTLDSKPVGADQRAAVQRAGDPRLHLPGAPATCIRSATTTRSRCCPIASPGSSWCRSCIWALRSAARCRSGTAATSSAIRRWWSPSPRKALAGARARAALDGAAAAPWRHAGGPLAARMRVPLDLYLPQCRAAEPRHGDRLDQHAQRRRGRDVQLAQPDAAHARRAPGSIGPIRLAKVEAMTAGARRQAGGRQSDAKSPRKLGAAQQAGRQARQARRGFPASRARKAKRAKKR